MSIGEMLNVFLAIGFIYIMIALLMAILPTTLIVGYAKDVNGKPLRYRCNSFFVLLIMEAFAVITVQMDLVSGSYLADHGSYVFFATFVYGFLLSFGLYLYGNGDPKNHVCAPKILNARSKNEMPINSARKFWFDFFYGFELNPRIGLWDLKMYLYSVGAIMLELNIFSISVAHYNIRGGSLSWANIVYLLEFKWFITEYMWFEHVHLYTYDIIDENVGFKLAWGCCCFYPEFYMIGSWSFASQKIFPDNPFILLASITIFIIGWILTRGANLQKYYFKRWPHTNFLWIPPKTIENRLLISGWWSLARHVNYLGEILQAIAIALPAGTCSASPWLYPFYYVVLFVTRERDDHKRCALKYGKLWERYCEHVPNRIIPYIY